MTRKRVTGRVVLGSVLFAFGQALSTLVFAPIAIAALAVPYRLRYRVVTGWTGFNLWWLWITCGLRHQVEGIENIPARPTVVLSKHQSAWETLALQRYFSPQVWVLKRELLQVPFFGWGLATLRPIAIDRRAGKNAIDQVREQGRDRLAEGIWVVVFPEGTRVPPGSRRRYRLGGAVLAADADSPPVPVAHNSGDFWPRNSFFKFPGTIRLVIGTPIAVDGRSAGTINQIAETWIETEVARLRGDPAPSTFPAGIKDLA